MTALLLSVLLTAADAPITVTAAGVQYVNLGAGEGDAYLDAFGARMARNERLQIITRTQVSQLLGFERQKELLGCGDASSSSCLAEIGGAVGAQMLVTGTIGKLGSVFTVSFKLVNAKSGASLATRSARYNTELELLEGLDSIADAFAHELTARKGLPVLEVGVIITAVAAVTSVSTFLLANLQADRLTTNSPAFMSASDIHSSAVLGSTLQQLGWISAGVAVIAGVATLVWDLVVHRLSPTTPAAPAVASW